MRILAASDVAGALDLESTVERLRQAWRGQEVQPGPLDLDLPTLDGPGARLSLLPAWQLGRFVGLRITTAFPGNEERDTPVEMSSYLLLDGRSGQPVALIDGALLVRRRAAATSALAAGYLARPDSERLLMIGAGAMAGHLIEAHAKVRPICNVLIWSRNAGRAKRLAKRLDRRDFRVAATEDLGEAVRGAHIICSATRSPDPLIEGAWLQEGQHLDLVGSTRLEVSECDAATLRRARLFVDSREETPHRSGELAAALAAGAIQPEDIAADLFELTRGERAGRRYYDQITLFKSVGLGLADLAAAQLVLQRR
ncbi:MAG: ornithine cyclodeaminase [Limibacillus sp.]|jgi:alanine dehydrogenase